MPTVRHYAPPQFQVEVDGFWRRLDPDSLGKGPNGEPVIGRTWVKEHIRWRDREQRPITVYVKSKISVARKRAKQITESPPKKKLESEVEGEGKIYVMINPSLKRDIFKVGRTKRKSEDRAKELSSSTGVATDFLVVEEWDVDYCALAEKMIHESLNSFRMTKKEFFKAPYKVIRKHIQEIVDKING